MRSSRVGFGISNDYAIRFVLTMFLPNRICRRHRRTMVGHPKTLMDLRKINAAITETCADCGHKMLIDREVMIHQRTGHRLSLDWAEFQAGETCGRCGGRNVTVLPMPYGEDARELRRWRAENTLMNLALRILTDAANRSSAGTVGSVEVRLALRVIHPFTRDESLLRQYWREATIEPRHPGTSCHLPLRWIVNRLIQRGYGVNAEFR